MLGRKKKRKKKKKSPKIKRVTDETKLAETKGCYDKFIENYFPDPVYSIFYSKSNWNDFMYDGMDLNSQKDVIESILDYAESEESFDIYQLCSFDANNDKKHYTSSVIKAILCLILQLPSIIFIIYGEIIGSDKTWCNNLNEDGNDFGIIVSKCLAFLYSFYVSFYIENYVQNKRRGMRCIFLTHLKNKPPFLNGTWLRIGGYYNDFSSYLVTVASYIIIFLAESQIDLVLNALALFFLIEIDDLLVTRFDYHKIFNFIKDEAMRNSIGFGIIDADHNEKGVKVTNIKQYVTKTTKLREGDIIDKVNGVTIEREKDFKSKYVEDNIKYCKQITFHVVNKGIYVNIDVFNESMRNNIGFSVYDDGKNEGVRVRNSMNKENKIIDEDIIDGVYGDDDEMYNIKTAQDFDEKYQQFQDEQVVKFHVKRNDDSFDVKVEIGAMNNNYNENESVWYYIYRFVDLPLRFVILIFKYIAPFYVGICS